MSAYQNHGSIPSHEGYSDVDVRDAIWVLGDIDLEVKIEFDYEIHKGGDATFYATQLNSDEEPRVVHAVYNDLEAFEKWVSDLADMDAPAQVEEIHNRQGEYDFAVQAGYGNWHRGTTLIERQAVSA